MSSRRPVVGIATALEIASYGIWVGGPCALLQYSYIESIQRAGAMAMMLPPDPALVENPDELLDRVDALVLAGGCDVDPARYGQEQHAETVGLVPARDDFEFALLERAIERDMPSLCVCRGMQVLNVVRGGTLIQHLPEVLHSDEHRRHLGTFEGNEHDVRLASGSLAALAVGRELTMTKSHHHQAIDALGDGLIVTGRCTDDDLAEAIELPDAGFVLGVQWHPEADETSRIMSALVEETRQRISVAS
ncbi:MAG TPA: gamma-glutamyl-gamma-aminobutyrate hydrolase family protein [Solirubrobacteraceae bacterium]|jgi:putative glutamine amidotransferase|nr:gamma-glutamyl-gamma-aminobutyrate hydrolase family protein [Solirubrobacteraceae bacterium]